MDGVRFDRLARLLSAPADRRAAARALAGGAIAALGLAARHDAAARKKKKKKCKLPTTRCGKRCCGVGLVCSGGVCVLPDECNFAKSALLWTLQADCTITRTITVPADIILDGSAKTITMTGQASAYTVAPGVGVAAGILAQGGSGDVRNLTIAGGGVQASQDELFAALALRNRSGLIEAVTISGIRPTAAFPNGFGIFASAGSGGHDVSLKDVAVSAVSATAVAVEGMTAALDDVDLDSDGTAFQIGAGTATVKDSLIASANVGMVATDSTLTLLRNTLRAPETAVSLFRETVAEVRNNTFDGTGKQALFGANGAEVTVSDNTVTGYTVGFFFVSATDFGPGADNPVTADVTGNTITGVGTAAGAGIQYGRLAAGDVSSNTVSNFLDGGPSQTNCGILVAADAGAVALGSNTFPDPPGNEQNVCDNRP